MKIELDEITLEKWLSYIRWSRNKTVVEKNETLKMLESDFEYHLEKAKEKPPEGGKK